MIEPRGRPVLTWAPGAIAACACLAGAAAPASPAAQGMTAGIRLPGARDASAIGVARPAGSWGRAIGVPGLGVLNTGGYAAVTSVSCASAGGCAAGGYFRDRRHEIQGFIVSRT